MIEKFKSTARYLLGPKVDKKIVIFESDDWGSIRIPNREIRDILIKKFPLIQNDPYSMFDTLASQDDLNYLFDILHSYKDVNGNHPCITANAIMTNPIFDAIAAGGYSDYISERFDETIKRYYSQAVLDMWHHGIANRIFIPQLHGREHVHSLQWLNELRAGNKELQMAFSFNTFSIPIKLLQGYQRNNLAAALNISGLSNEKEYHRNFIYDAAKIFREYFGHHSVSFIAPAYIWNSDHEYYLSQCGVSLLQGIGYQYSVSSSNSFKKVFHYTGQRNSYRQYYIVRNAFFEPSLQPNKDWVSECLKRIDLAFRFRKPAIIGTHRVNFIGTLVEKNRTNNLKLFNHLLSQILKRWPDVEFASSADLIKLITDKQQG